MLIRDARVGDAEGLAALIAELGFEATPSQVAERLQAQAEDGAGALVSVADSVLAGCVSWSLMRVLHRPGPVGRISMLVVTAAQRGRGHGGALAARAEARCAALGCVLMEVTSNTALQEAHGFYEARGYRKTSFRFAKPL